MVTNFVKGDNDLINDTRTLVRKGFSLWRTIALGNFLLVKEFLIKAWWIVNKE